MPTDDELLDLLGQALDPGDRAPAPDRVAALRAAVARGTFEVPHTAPGANIRRRPWLTGVAAALLRITEIPHYQSPKPRSF